MTDKDVSAEESLERGSDSEHEEKEATQYLLNSPAYLSSLMRRQCLHEMVKSLPEKMQKRIKALKGLQFDCLEMEAKFFKEVYELERKYQDKYQPLQDKRREIVEGTIEPEDKEQTWKSDNEDDDDEEEVSEKLKEFTIGIKKNMKDKYPADSKGIPDFWLTVFRSVELLASMVQEHDEAALKHLQDIKIVYQDNPMSFTLEFVFGTNDFFSNTVLTKQYFLKSTVDREYPFLFEGPEIFKCTGCVINWHKGKNLTVKTIKKKQKHKARGAVRTVNKQVPTDSFFNFFNPPLVESEDKMDVDTQSTLGTDYEIGHFLRSRIIPKAVLYYTGDIVDDDDDDDFDEEEDEDDEDDDEDEDDDDDEGPPQRAPKNKKGGNPAECPQQ